MMSRESRAAERIVCNCRIFLSRQKYRRLEEDLTLVCERRQNCDRHQHAKAMCIQRVFRGYQCRRQYRNVNREKAAELANLSFQNTITFNLKTRIHRLEEKRATLDHLFQVHEKSLNKLQRRTDSRVVKVRLMKQTNHEESLESFLDSSLKSYEAMLNCITDELDFVNKLRVKNHSHVLRLQENFSNLHHNDNVIMSVSKFLYRNRNNKDEENRNDIVERMRLACDHDLERILYRENNIIDADIAALLLGSQMSAYKIEMLMKLRGFEVEDHCLHLHVQKNQVKTLEAASIIEWIDSVQDKMYKCRKELAKVFHDLEVFYKDEEDRMNMLVLFSNHDGILSAKCKISPIGEPARFDYKRWKEDYQKCVEESSKDSPHHLAMVKLRDYIEDRCKFLRESDSIKSENQVLDVVEAENECGEEKGILKFCKTCFVVAERFLSKAMNKVIRNSTIVPVMDEELETSQRYGKQNIISAR